MRAPRIAVIDYGMGNRRSVQKALETVGGAAAITSDPGELATADGLVLPGVGAFPVAMRNIRSVGLDQLLRERLAAGVPLLGICLGMQLLFEASTELGATAGLGLLEGEVSALNAVALRVPHIGWNEVRFERGSRLTEGLPEAGCAFYHVHSYVARPSDPSIVVGRSEYGEPFATLVERGNVFGAQFHPEKSSRDGLRLLANFAAVCAQRGAPARAPAQA